MKAVEKKVEKVRSVKRLIKEKGKKALLYSFIASTMITTNVYATESVTQPLANLKTLVISIIAAVGVIILAKNVMEFAQAYQQQDSSSMNSGG